MKNILFLVWIGLSILPLGAQEAPLKMTALLVIQDDYGDFELNSIAQGVKKDYAQVTRFLDTLESLGLMQVH